ncbi:MAG: TIGR03617 family F420-dependent LLM class oxidoreductase [bacterium]|nr:TIGR03617 family F420-dependent LLM class oxidoreductase [bacterium]MCY3952873.1 TIGR03617 family F420-dependent LLM class oxidoreductase [bacterium]MCY4104626.1 TIGR03617 family F420-dependent LLM class oxidoreductase [bacterium]
MRLDATLGSDPTAAARRARQLEEGGYDGGWTSETNHDPFLPLVAAAQHTEHLELGTNIAVAFARNPMTTAHAAWDLQLLSGGRFILGLGSQIKPHITRRFSMPWSRPAARMREYIEALHAIWDAWETGGKLNFRGDFYQHTLTNPMFVPPPQPHRRPDVYLAAVGPLMTRTAGQVADGLHCHGFTTADYVRDVTLPALREGEAAGGRPGGEVRVSLLAMAVAADTAEAFEEHCRTMRMRIAFYGSTPAYRGVLEHHGWGDAQTELHALSVKGRWAEMADVIDDEMLHTIAAVGTPAEAAAILAERYGDLVDRLTLVTTFDSASTDRGTDPQSWALLLEQLRRAVADRRPTTPDPLRPPG